MYPLGIRPVEEDSKQSDLKECKVFLEQIKRSYPIPEGAKLEVITQDVQDKLLPETQVWIHGGNTEQLAVWYEEFDEAPPETWDVISKSQLGIILSWYSLREGLLKMPSNRDDDPVFVEFRGTLFPVKELSYPRPGDSHNAVIKLIT